MAELEEKLNAILSDPQAMEQILSAARVLSGQPSDGSEAQEEANGAHTPSGSGADPGGADSLFSALGDLDPKLLQAGMRLLSELGSGDDRRVALLTALRPFVKEERYAKLDRAIQIARLSRVIRAAFTLFKEGGGQEHV